MMDQSRVDRVARAIIEHVGGVKLTDEEWRAALEDEPGFVEEFRRAARVAIEEADRPMGRTQ